MVPLWNPEQSKMDALEAAGSKGQPQPSRSTTPMAHQRAWAVSAAVALAVIACVQLSRVGGLPEDSLCWLPGVGIARRVLLTSPQTRLHTVIVGLFGEFAMTTSPSLTFEKRGVTASMATERQKRAIRPWFQSLLSPFGTQHKSSSR